MHPTSRNAGVIMTTSFVGNPATDLNHEGYIPLQLSGRSRTEYVTTYQKGEGEPSWYHGGSHAVTTLER